MQIIEVRTTRDKQAFLDLPDRLYAGPDRHEDRSAVAAFLDGTHPLSDDARITHYLCKDGPAVLGRMTLTLAPAMDTLFLGYFECVRDPACADALFARARQEAAALGLSSVTGPVNVSFWVGYRLKLDQFDRVYMGEPQNLPYYPELFRRGGFHPVMEYVSHYHRAIPHDYELTRFRQRSELMRARGIRLVHPDFGSFDRCLGDIHELIMELYADFPAFVPISRADFTAMFRGLKTLADPRYIVMAYDGARPVGFFISFPDYGNGLATGSTLRKLWHLMRVRHRPRHIILSYSGVRRGYEGLSGALYYETLSRLKALGLPAVSTLMQKGKVTAGFEKGLVQSTTHYALYRSQV